MADEQQQGAEVTEAQAAEEQREAVGAARPASQPENGGQKGECGLCGILKDKKKLMIGGGLIVLLLIIFCCLFSATERQTNVVFDLPMGGQVKIGVLEAGSSSAALSDVRLIDPMGRDEGTIQKIVIEDTDMRAFMNGTLKSIGLIEAHGFDADGSKAKLVRYKGLKLDFPLLLSMAKKAVTAEDIAKLADSFYLKSGEAVDFSTVDGPVTVSFARSLASDVSTKGMGESLVENLKVSMGGQSLFSIGSTGFKKAAFPNIGKLFKSSFVMLHDNIDGLMDVMEDSSINGWYIKDLKAALGNVPNAIQLKKLSFDMRNAKRKVKMDLDFDGLQISKEAARYLDISIPKDLDISGEMKTSAESKGKYIDIDQDLSVKGRNLADLSFKGNFLLESNGGMGPSNNANLTIKDKGLVKLLPMEARLMLMSQASTGDDAIDDAFKAFLDKPGSTLKVKIRESSGRLDIDADVN